MDPEETLLIKEAKRLKKQVHLGKYMLENQIDLAFRKPACRRAAACSPRAGHTRRLAWRATVQE